MIIKPEIIKFIIILLSYKCISWTFPSAPYAIKLRNVKYGRRNPINNISRFIMLSTNPIIKE